MRAYTSPLPQSLSPQVAGIGHTSIDQYTRALGSMYWTSLLIV